jgi:hypothetical protein
MLSKRHQQKIARSIDTLFHGLEDDTLKEIMLACALNKTQEEKDAICEELRLRNQQEYEERLALFEIQANAENPNGAIELTQQSRVIITEEAKPDGEDNVHGAPNQGLESPSHINPDHE